MEGPELRPSKWTRIDTGWGQPSYYVNDETNETTWTLPQGSHAKPPDGAPPPPPPPRPIIPAIIIIGALALAGGAAALALCRVAEDAAAWSRSVAVASASSAVGRAASAVKTLPKHARARRLFITAASRPSLTWYAPFLSGGGYCSEATAFVSSLAAELAVGDLRIVQHGDGYNAKYVQGLPSKLRDDLRTLQQVRVDRSRPVVALCHSEPGAWVPSRWERTRCPPDGAAYSIGRTMFETDRLPDGWAERLNRMDEVWVPSRFNLETFAAGGVNRSRIVVVPEPVDTVFFDPDRAGVADDAARDALRVYAPEIFADGRGERFRFLSIFKWEERKGWDVLLRAFLNEFDSYGGEDEDDHDTRGDATLFLLTNPYHNSMGEEDFRAEVARLRQQIPGGGGRARVVVLTPGLPQRVLPSLYAAVDAFVLPSRGEGWGRPHAEAMAMQVRLINFFHYMTEYSTNLILFFND